MHKLIVFGLFLSGIAQASIVGVSTHPLEGGSHLINTEFISDFGNEDSYGVQAKYLHQLSSRLNLDAGFRVLKSDFSSLLLSGTYELFPDYEYQPQISLKAFYEFENFSSGNRNHLGLAPILGKGFSFWGVPAFPYVSAPIGVRLDNDSSETQLVSSVVLGVSGKIPYENLSKVIANLETNLNLKNSSSSVALGVSVKFQ